MSIYLDYNATTPIDERVLDTMVSTYKIRYGNADSRTHDYGDQARHTVENARKQVATLLGINSDEIFFTSGATESNNIALQGLDEYATKSGKKHIITTAIEHKAVLETAKALSRRGYDVEFINPDISGRIEVKNIANAIRDDTLVVSVMHVNNETGIIQPVNEIGDMLFEKNILFHVDATQSCGKLIDEVKALKYDMLSFSAHKLRGPQGIGVLALRKKNYRFPPIKGIMYGGQQEHGIRPGTIPVALIAGCGKACEIAAEEHTENIKHMIAVRETILALLEESKLKYCFNGDQECCIANTINVCFEGVSSEALMLSTKQYCGVSNGSACTSNSYSPSYVLKAMGIDEDRIENSIRISWGADTDIESLKKNMQQLIAVAEELV